MSDTSWEGYSQCLSLLSDATFCVTMAFYQRLNLEMLGAYRSGYEALDIVHSPDITKMSTDSDWNAAVTSRVGFLPSKKDSIRQYPTDYSVASIDLSMLDDIDLEEFRESWSDFDE